MKYRNILLAIYLLCVCNTYGAYAVRYHITVDHTKVGTVNNTDQTAFTFPICANGASNCNAIIANFATVANGGVIQHTVSCCAASVTVPADMIITTDDACTTQIAGWDFEAYDATTGSFIVWGIDNLSHTVDTVLTVCAGNAAVSTYQATYTSAYDSHHKIVYHYNEGTSSTIHDSTIGAFNSTSAGASASPAAQIGTGRDFSDGSKFSHAIATYPPQAAAVRMSATWFNLNGKTGVMEFISWGTNSSGQRWSFFWNNGDGKMYLETAGAMFASIPYTTDAVWHHLAWVLPAGCSNANCVLMYLDGASVSTSFTAGALSTGNTEFDVNLAAGANADTYIGLIDESGVDDIDRSADWIKTLYNSQHSPGTFLSISGPLVSSLIRHRVIAQ